MTLLESPPAALGAPVSNEEVAACAKSSCRDCVGKGYLYGRVEGRVEPGALCGCATARFDRRYADRVVRTKEGVFWRAGA